MYRTLAVATSAISAAAIITGTQLAMAGTGPARAGTEHLQIMTTAASSNTETIIATGAFTGGGTDTERGSASTVKLPGGTFRIRHRDTGKGHQSFNPSTCLLRASQPGKYTLTDGTGKFAGISGSGTFTLTITAVATRTAAGKCDQARPPAAYEQVITAHGPVTFAH